jgi:hypothetical protein
MTVGELRDLIQEMLDDGRTTENSPVIIVTQERWPFESSTAGVTLRGVYEDPEDFNDGQTAEDFIICEGDQLGYGSKDAWGATE